MDRFLKVLLIFLTLIAVLIFIYEGQQSDGLDPESEARASQYQGEGLTTKSASQPKHPVELPDFASILDVNEKKQAFVDFLLPAITQANQAIMQERQFLISIKPKALTSAQRKQLEALAEKYQQPRKTGQTKTQWVAALLKKVDKIPPSLALAQAANESAWGTSRFAVEGMNFYGQWCFSVGCGLVPNSRPAGKTYEVRLFENPQQSVEAYMLNLNAFHTYQDLRKIRLKLQEANQQVSGEALAEGLLAYSQRREEYIKEIQAMIRFNQWQEYDH